ncbi:MAG: ATP-binding cassette domain-containing protein [Oscillospiraceae bacterium]|nr:ATP-binding cassette domain-containing protein [Oscillospiraceae bacterium]
MGWFGNQIEERREADRRQLEDAFVRVAGVVMGRRGAERIGDGRAITKNAIDEILKYYHLRPVELPEDIKGPEEQLAYCLRPYGMMWRKVELTKGWYRDAYGPMLAFRRDGGMPAALLPGSVSGYYFRDGETGRRVRLDAKTEALFETGAICFYRPLPLRKIGIADLVLYMKRCVTMRDMAYVILAAFAISGVGLLVPRITRALTGPVLASGRTNALLGAAVCLLCVSLSAQLLNSVRTLLTKRLETKTELGVQASMMMRLLSLPASFFRQYSAGELKSRSMSVNQLCSLLMNFVLTAGLTSLSSLLYVTQIFHFAPMLVLPSLAIVLATVGFSVLTARVELGISKKRAEHAARESGMSYAVISGVQKIKLAGAEKRIFARWLNLYAEGAELSYNPPLFLKVNAAISTGISLFSNILLYFLAVRGGLDPSTYFAFTAAYGALMGAFTMLTGAAISAARIRPILEMARPFLNTEPEALERKEIVADLKGGIELNHVFFRYSEDTPYVLRDLSMKIRPGEYVAVVGRTGCGKSTLLRLLLGFETPEKGAIYYDGRDIAGLDLGSLRRKIGTVMQQGGLFRGDIYSNIVLSAPWLTISDAWEAAEKACIADDIRAMPMGMHTLISEGGGGISGGQKQRLMIARAIAPRPRLLLFDEATSALDNRSQRRVSEALDAMGCTRLVIAHRLSTVRRCDRILVLDGGRIVEEGSYDELVAKGGFFAGLVERQRTDS